MDNIDNQVKQVKREYFKKYRDKNKEKLNKYQREYRASNKDKVKEYNKNYWIKRVKMLNN